MKPLLAALTVCLFATAAFAEPVDMSSLRYDFGAGIGTGMFAVNDGADADPNDSFDATFPFDIADNAGNNKHALTADVWSTATDLSGFGALEMAIHVDEDSALDAFGFHGFLQIVIRNGDNYDYTPVSSFNLETGMTEISIMDLSAATEARALTFDLYGGPDQNTTGNVILSVQDIKLVPIPEPATSLLSLIAIAISMAYCRRRR